MGAIIGQKKEMTQIYSKEGEIVPCTIIDVSDVRVVGKRSKERDGYTALILGLGKKRKPTKAQVGQFKNVKFVPRVTLEFRLSDEEIQGYKEGAEVKASIFEVGEKVNISGLTKGKGFQGVVKRWGFKGGQRTHGQSDRQRAGGSIGAGTDPGRVFKGKKMPGHMGNVTKTIKNLEIVKVDEENNILCVRGAVPGGRNTVLKIAKPK